MSAMHEMFRPGLYATHRSVPGEVIKDAWWLPPGTCPFREQAPLLQ